MAKTGKKSYTLLIVLMSVAAALAIALSVAAMLLKTMANTYLGKGAASIVKVEGSEDWNTDYYSPTYRKDKAGAVKNGERVTKALCDEGFVLLKNKDRALPLDAGSDVVSLIGRGAVDPLYGGSGSGNVDTAKAVTPYDGIRQAGFTMDPASYNYFNGEKSKYTRCSIKMDRYNDSQWLIGEIAYTDAAGNALPFAVSGNGTAVFFVSRAGGEGWDLSNNLKRDAAASATFAAATASGTGKAEYDTYAEGQHQLELSQYEKNWLAFCKKNYKKTVVVINSSNVMEMGELQADDGVDAVLWVGGPGSSGFNALGDILAGRVNPSGRTADIWPADFTADPTFPNAGEAVRYTDIGAGDVANGGADNNAAEAYTTCYEEGIYLGYRWYETAAQEKFIDYASAVVYPFGYGLSYTTFDKSVTWSENADSYTATVTVENTGEVPGKEVVQLYFSAPYTAGGIEKSAVELADFAKTKLLKKGEKDALTLTLPKREMASYDYKGVKIKNGGYVLEKGDYVLSIRDDSHTVSAGEDMTRTVTIANDVLYTQNGIREDGDLLVETKAAKNQFNDLSAMFDEGTGHASLLSRADFKNTYPTAPSAAQRKAKEITLTYEENGKTVSRTVAEMLKPFDAATQLRKDNVSMPAMNRNKTLVLSNMRGIPYGDDVWEDYLDQLTDDDYKKANLVLINGAYNTGKIDSLGKTETKDFDGPQGFSSLWGSTGCCAYCSEVVIASTFNTALAREMGVAVGEESLAEENDIQGWYGPAMNIHRSPFAGRNFEYYSEDPLLSGKIAAAVVEGAAAKGCYGYIKHFALNDTEVARIGNLCTWADEQTLREIYLEPFRYVVENAKVQMKYTSDAQGTVSTRTMPACTAVMSSFNRVGGTWAGGSYPLMSEVLRDEWGFRGLAISDFNLYDFMDPDQGIRAGTNLQLTWSASKADYKDTSDPVTRQAIRQAYKNMCYTVANSNRMQNVAPGSVIVYGLAWWQITVIVFDVLAGLFVVGGLAYILLDRQRRQTISLSEEE